jgi:hypothetical protein
MANFASNCKGIAGRRQNCQVHAGQRTENCKGILGQVIYIFTGIMAVYVDVEYVTCFILLI